MMCFTLKVIKMEVLFFEGGGGIPLPLQCITLTLCSEIDHKSVTCVPK